MASRPRLFEMRRMEALQIKGIEAAFLTFQRITKKEAEMSAAEIANVHFLAAIKDAEAAGLGHDIVCRALLGLVVAKYLETRNVSDVQSELRFVADHCDPGTDFAFMRP